MTLSAIIIQIENTIAFVICFTWFMLISMKRLKVSIILISVLYAVSLANWEANFPTSYIFAPGIFETEGYAANYCGTYKGCNGESVICGNGIKAFQEPYTSITFGEIVLDNLNGKDKKQMSFSATALNTIQTLRRHSLEKQKHLSYTGTSTTSTTLQSWQLDNAAVNFGQEKDMATLDASYDKHLCDYPGNKVVFYGFSRGSAVMFNYLATDYKKKTDQRVAACVLEACFDEAPLPTILKWFFPGYNSKGLQPINVVKLFPKDIPVLFITSAKDSIVSSGRTWKLYCALRKSGHKHAYYFELSNSSHPGYTFQDETDRANYQKILHAFYKKYHLTFDAEFATQGEELLAQAQP
jgi:hypothetical protein